ncbi:MAG: flavodoxin family protein [Clostridiales bacterium]|jgi:multimeric flavodoxin WrbA|nr:flavodoxin family protein [Clostridiales bacterium]
MAKKASAINGSPRKGWNTAILLEKALEGAKAAGADTELFSLYDLDYKGCVSCFSCKRKGAQLEQCVLMDGLAPVLKKIHACDALILGSPIYFGDVTGEMRSFMERLFFPYASYDKAPSSFGKKIGAAFIYTMNVGADALEKIGYQAKFDATQGLLERILGHGETLISTETLQFDDYGKYAASAFDAAQRAERRKTVFVDDCKAAFALGQRLVE